MKGRVLFKLTIEEQVAGPCGTDIARNEEGIALHQGLRVGELGEGSVEWVGGIVGAGLDTKQVRSERRQWVDVLLNRGQRRHSFERLAGLPRLVVGVKCSAIAPAQERGAVVDLGGKAIWRQGGGGVGESCEPGAEGEAVGGAVQAQRVGCPVVEGVLVIGDKLKVQGSGLALIVQLKSGTAGLHRTGNL